jgi:response regulator RpfG family c-di-GMP phosphodiesterase
MAILVVEDSRTQAQWIRGVLEQVGYRVTVAWDGVDALDAIKTQRPGMVLSDVDMPRIDGFELCRVMKSDPGMRLIPFVMVTQRDRVTDLVRALEVGADNYIAKPLDRVLLLARVGRIAEAVRDWGDRYAGGRYQLAPRPEEVVLSLERTQVVEMLMATAQKLEDELGAVGELGHALTTTRDLGRLLPMLAERTRELADADLVAVALRDAGGAWHIETLEGGDDAAREWLHGFTFEGDTSVLDRLGSREHIHLLSDADDAGPTVRSFREHTGAVSLHLFPMFTDGQLVGVLITAFNRLRSFSADEHRRFRQLASHAAVAIQNARLFQAERALRERLETAYRAEKEAHKNAMFMLAAAVERRDGLTGSHLRRVQAYTEAVARALGLPAEVVEEIGYSSVMHDVGKLLVPEELLGKAGPLTTDEWHEMRRHPDHGAQILGEREFFAMARDIARCHHEKWDGSGYQGGLSGDAIPIAARITSVADVFDALTTERSYKPRWTDGSAIAELERLAGASFDPAVVRAFLRLWSVGEIDRIRRAIESQGTDAA